MGKKVGVDMDGVLARCHDAIAYRLKTDLGIELHPDEIDYGFDIMSDRFDVDRSWVPKNLFTDDWFWATLKPYEENILALRRWADEGHEIHVVTGRSADAAKIVTKKWLERQEVPVRGLHFARIMSKHKVLLQNEIPVMFEDMFFEANKIAAFGIKSFIVRRNHNIAYEQRITNPLVTYVTELMDADDYINDRISV